MEALSSVSSPSLPPSCFRSDCRTATSLPALTKIVKLGNSNNYKTNHSMKFRKLKNLKVKLAMTDVSQTAYDPAQAQLTWQIIVGTLAGITPFVVAGIEFSKRIVAQRKCEMCKGSGLVLRDKKYYFRCPTCGGFLPWQSWRRFFWG